MRLLIFKEQTNLRIPAKLETKIDKLSELAKEIARAKALLERTVEYAELERFKADYAELEQNIIGSHAIEVLRGTKGRRALLGVTERVNYKITDWDEFNQYVFRTEGYDLFQRRVSAAAVMAREEEGEEVPGLEKFTSVTIKPREV